MVLTEEQKALIDGAGHKHDAFRCAAEERALAEDRMVVCTAGRTLQIPGAVLLELRRRSATSERWIDVADAITGRKRRPGGGRVPGLMRVIQIKELRDITEVGLGGMQLRNRKLPKPKRHILQRGSRADRLPRGTRGCLRYQATVFPGSVERLCRAVGEWNDCGSGSQVAASEDEGGGGPCGGPSRSARRPIVYPKSVARSLR